MAITKSIPAGTLKPGTHTVGPYNVPAGLSTYELSAHLTQAAGVGNSVGISVQTSADGGKTWDAIAGSPDMDGSAGLDFDWACSGGFGVLILEDDGTIRSAPDTSRPQLKGQIVITAAGAPLSVSNAQLVVS